MHSLLIANIPHDCDEKELQEWMQALGVRVRNLKLITDLVSGTSPSFAQIQLANPADTDAIARSLDGQELRNRRLRAKALELIDTSKPTHYLRATA